MEYSSNAKGNLGVALGAVGTGLGILDGMGGLAGKLFGGGSSNPEDRPVTRYEAGLMEKNTDQKIENAYLRGQLETAEKLAGVQKQFTEQVGFNAAISANLNAVAGQTAALQNSFNSLTKIFVPNENVAPGWGKAVVNAVPFYPNPFGPFFPFPGAQPPAEATSSGTTTNSNNG